jgi:tetratricopeptide (TPR) repeat protein
VAAGLVAATCVVFWPALRGSFLQIDDPAYVTANPVVSGGLSLGALRAVVSRDTASMWVPLAMVSHLADVSLWGLDPWGHHLTSVLLHALTVGLLFLVLHAMTGAPWRSAVAALLFGLHPLRVESVAWIAERKDVLSGLLAVLTVGAHVRWTRRPTAGGQALTCGLFALGMLAKPMVVTLPVLLLLLDVWPLERTAVPWRRRLLEKVPLVVVALAGAAATVAVVGRTGGLLSLREFPIGARAENAIVSYARYLGLTVWPHGLAVYYPLPTEWPPLLVAASFLVIAALAGIAIVARRAAPYLLVGLGWFAIALVPVIGLTQAGSQAMADRFTYLPAIGLAVAVVWGLGDVLARLPRLVPAATVGGMLAMGLVVHATRVQIGHWRDDRALFEQALAVTNGNWFVHAVYGDALREQGALDEAAAHYERALALEPRMPQVHAALGAVRYWQGDTVAAVHQLVEAIRLDPTNSEAAKDLALALEARGLDAAVARGTVATLRRGVAAARRDRKRPEGEEYYGVLIRELMARHTQTVGRCREQAGRAEPFDLFVTVAPDGAVASAETSPPSALGACIAGGLTGSRFPSPPFAPFHARLAMNLAG